MIRLVVREYTAVLEENIEKFMYQQEIPMVAGLDNALAERIVSRPTSGKKQVFNIVWDPESEELVFEVSETAET